jgi:hypothetical protein
LLAESLHSLADSGNQALLLLGRKQATAPATVSHPLGQWPRDLLLGVHRDAAAFHSRRALFDLRRLRKDTRRFESNPMDCGDHRRHRRCSRSISLRVTLEQIAGVRGDTSLFRWFRETREAS